MVPSLCMRIEGISQRPSVVCRFMKEELNTVRLTSRWQITRAEDIVVLEVVADLVGRIARGSINVLPTVESIIARDGFRYIVSYFNLCQCLLTLQ